MRATLLGLAVTLLAVPATGRAQMPRPVGPRADLRTVRVVAPDVRRAVPHAPPHARSRAPAVILVGPSWTAWTDVAAPAVAPVVVPARPRVPRTRVIEVGEPAAADSACAWATHARALTDCLGAAVRAEDERLATATVRAREALLRTRPAATVAAFDGAAAAWSRYRERECLAQSLALGGTAGSYQGLACHLRLSRERRALLDGAAGGVSGAAPAPAR